jgi:CheY-like chemotaxis protein
MRMEIEGSRLLIVDDEELTRRVLRDDLEERGATVFEARNGRDALRVLEGQDGIDMVVTDIIMPDMEGISFIIEARKRFPRIKILAISGGGLVEPRDYLSSAHRLGADAALEKPFSPSQLAEEIATL